ncbi:MAG: DUF4038 domain-containing protein [Planctomycetes bacterium]|nr:DUF4038 domain-containing protein [Planctomycetota bacterium]
METTDGRPFFWLADTVWSGPAVASLDDWNTYLVDRKAKRFSVVQFNAICPWRVNPADAAGQIAYTSRDPLAINEHYFARLDRYFDAIERHSLVAAPVLAWAHTKGDAGTELNEDDLVRLCRFQVERYTKRPVVWILAGDNRYTPEESTRWRRIGRRVFADFPDAVVTTHPTGMNWPWNNNGWRDEKWLSFLSYQSGHGDDVKTLQWLVDGPAAKNWNTKPIRPIINLEPPYEDHIAYQSKRPHSAYSVRRATYWSLLNAPIAGVTYGAHGIWSWQTESGGTPAAHAGSGVAKRWKEALELPGGAQMKHVVDLFEGMEWWNLRPAPEVLAAQPGRDDPTRFIAIATDKKKESLVAYLPVGGEIRLAPSEASSFSRFAWFDPREGKSVAVLKSDGHVYSAPTNDDWVFVALPRQRD